ncbi:MAG: sugar ABC transporter substrate-binding protein [Clostridia bacterium]|nr:sugar ABC transporter substrate-binding protein [Clostridia bacterium]
MYPAKRFFKVAALIMSAIMAVCMVACEDEAASGEVTVLKFFSWGNETEVELTRHLVDDFNEKHKGEIEVSFTPIPSGDYETKLNNALRGRNVPDVIIAGDGEVKQWIDQGAIAELDDMAAASSVIDLDKMWADGVNRYRYDMKSRRGGVGKLYGIMRDYSPSVLFYNKTAMNAVGITCISMEKEQSLSTYGTDSAYFEYGGKYYFNNRIATTWEELLALSQKLTSNTAAPVRNNASITKFGMYVINWFCFGWSVGGNCLEWVEDASLPGGGKYQFTLFDETKNYIVNSGESVTVGGNTYAAGEIVSYKDKALLTSAQKNKCTELPSQVEAMQYFVDLSVKHGVSPKPDVSQSNSNYGLFSSEQCAMLIDTRYAVGIFRKTIADESAGGFDWDVAPLPKHKDGIMAGHSGSLAYCIPEKSTKKEAAWKFIEYMAGPEGQTGFAEAGFTIPNTMELSNSEVFLQPSQKPANSSIFVDAAYYQRTGDWGYLPSKAWINEWANDLNNKVLLGTMTLKQLENKHAAETQRIIDAYFGG